MKGRFCVDANIFIAAWNTYYHKKIFHSLWDELAERKAKIILIKPIYDEIDPISDNDKRKSQDEKRKKYPLQMWLIENRLTETSIDSRVEKLSLELEEKYETDKDSRGANQQDIKLIAYAKMVNSPVVTFEKQKGRPSKKLRGL